MLEVLGVIAQIILVIGGLFTVVSIPLMIGIWIFRPVDRAAKDREHPTQFTILDFFCLFFIIQLAMAVIHWQFGLGPDAQMEYVYIFDGFAWFACGALWMKSVQLMSRAGIKKPWHRVYFLAVIIPGTLVAAMATPALLSISVGMIANTASADEEVFSLPVMLAILAAIPPILYVLAKSTRRIVAAAEPPPLVLVAVELVEQGQNS